MQRCKWGTSMAAGVCLLLVGGSTAFAQGATPRVEVGGQVNVLPLVLSGQPPLFKNRPRPDRPGSA